MRKLLRIFGCLYLLTVSAGFGPRSTAVEKVRQGIHHFANAEFAAAGQAFNEADVAEPENLTIAFDRACTFAASGDVEQAKELFQQAAVAREIDLAVKSHYNLGCLAAEEGRATLGEEPVQASPEQRQQGMSHLLSAVGHYRDALQLQQDHADTRHNLELIRLFIKHIQAAWEQQDREQARQEMGLLEFLAMIEQRQIEQRSTVRILNQQPDSPQRRQTVHETAEKQAELKQEIEPLKEKIMAELAASDPPQQGPGQLTQTPTDESRRAAAQQLLVELADKAANLMDEAAAAIPTANFENAEQIQRDVLDQLNQIFMAVAPFTDVLQRALRRQEQLTQTSDAAVPVDPGAAEEATTASSSPAEDAPGTDSAQPGDDQVDFPEQHWQQSRVTDWSRMLSLKAQAELPQVKAQLEASAATEDSPTATDASPGQPVSPEVQAADSAADLDALQQSLQKGIELGPQVEEHSAAAASNLDQQDSAAALPDQRQAEQLLREIAEPLAQQNQQQDEQPRGDDNDESGDQNQQPQQQAENKQRPESQSDRTPQERAMSALRRARERERQHRELQKQLQQQLGGQIQVERDW